MACLAAGGALNPAQGGAPPENRAVKLRLIALLEDRLAHALSFQGPGKTPDFSTLDEIFPSWDQGDPGAARRVWVEKTYIGNEVSYRVDVAYLTSDFTARLEGKKRVRASWAEPFLWGFTATESQEVETSFVIYVFRTADGAWRIRKEIEL
ncbi:MAG: hypothetical protein KQJ78_16610 [Deltaproteobacteria bacterium]|nr:hypothetical protein [Deltaproteobacteria bacterium]